MVLPVETVRQGAMHVDGSGVFSDVPTFLAFLVTSINADAASLWVISDSGTNHVELKPKVGGGALDEDDRVLLFGGVNPNAAALGIETTAATTQLYICMAPSAGTTGPSDPTAGDPYPGVDSSLLITGVWLETKDCDRFYVLESENKFGFNLVDSSSLDYTTHPLVIGRFHINNDGDLEPALAGTAGDMSTTCFELLSPGAPGAFFNPGTIPHDSAEGRFMRFNGSSWEQIKRSTAQRELAGRSPSTTRKFFTEIQTMTETDNAGRLHQIRLSYQANSRDVIDDGQGKLAYALAAEVNDASGHSAVYFMDV